MPTGVLPGGGIALVTGGSRGLGLATACAYAEEGATGVVILDVLDDATMQEAKKQIEALGAKCLAIHCDVTKEIEVEKAIAQTVSEFGRLDYAANFAGITGGAVTVEDMDVNHFEKIMSVNSTGLMLCCKHEIRQMAKQEPLTSIGPAPQRGAIVNCASINATMTMYGTVAYTASKHAVHGITKTTALEARRHNIRVNAVSPGFFRTELVEAGLKAGQVSMEIWGKFEARQGRAGVPFDVASTTVMMSSPKMSLVTAQNLAIDGGFLANEFHE